MPQDKQFILSNNTFRRVIFYKQSLKFISRGHQSLEELKRIFYKNNSNSNILAKIIISLVGDSFQVLSNLENEIGFIFQEEE